MASREELHEILKGLLGSDWVYYQPPESTKMNYTAIRYSMSDIRSTFSNDKRYSFIPCYELIVIARKPNDPVIAKILELPYSSYVRHYVADNLNHDVIRLYF